MHPLFQSPSGTERPIPIWFVTPISWPKIRAELGERERKFTAASGYEPKAGHHLLMPDAQGGLGGILFAIEDSNDAAKNLFRPGALPSLLPSGLYRFANTPHDVRLAALAFALGTYRFARYRKADAKETRLVLPEGVDGVELSRIIEGVTLARNLVNTPSNDMGPAELEDAARALASRHGAMVQAVTGDDLLARNFPLIHAVGRASVRPPRLIDLTWGNPADAKVTIVGKGVCFDSGGLDIKSESAMLLMKKDMGGAAAALALAHMAMDHDLKIRLRVLIPAVENSVAGGAFRPLDVYPSRKGITVEVGNTDAEGRLVLADALTLADEEAPDFLVDMGTLTGAARVALGPELPPFYTANENLAAEITRMGAAENDFVWRLPLWRPYDAMLESKIADINNVSSGSFAGSITCALVLNRFVTAAKTWAHFDVYSWNPSTKPGRPEGGECQAARLLYALLKARYG
ncbi:MAG: leucyl aminopeptidase family protein [Rhizobiales bacterium]|nr:leucyl aminopeptidase family protein [Hyphomicrobiales bacterium]